MAKTRLVAKIRRTQTQAYGTRESWAALGLEVWAAYGNRCSKCGKHKSEIHALGRRCETHHIIPISRGGRTVKWNLKPVCSRCHELMPGHSHLRGHR